MQKVDAKEGAGIMQRSIFALLGAVPTLGRNGADFRTACGQMIANAEAWIASDVAGPPLALCFDTARQAGATQGQLASVRNTTIAEAPKTVGGTMIRDSIVQMCLSAEGYVIANMTFVSREDVDALREEMNDVFSFIEEAAADAMDQMTFRAVTELHAAVVYYLVQTARPLPRMVSFAFALAMPTLTMAQRLYADGGRADELRQENKVVHPAFAPPVGKALSS
jgi:prophage DNA circulation protein